MPYGKQSKQLGLVACTIPNWGNLAKGAAQANLSPVELCKCLSILPSKSVIERFDKYTSPLIEKLIKCEREISTLTKQRDELLPLLINGQATANYHLSSTPTTAFGMINKASTGIIGTAKFDMD